MRFLRRIATLIRYLTTARDNQTPSLIRIAAIGIVLEFLWLAAWSVIVNRQDFSPELYGIGATSILVGIGGALRISLKTNSGNDV